MTLIRLDTTGARPNVANDLRRPIERHLVAPKLILILGNASSADAERLRQAFAATLKSLHLVDRNDPVCEIVARKVVEIDAAGIHDPDAIAKTAARELGPN
ncbi:hypothetical protein [Bradyrhizobium sp. Ghvi]|uniref:hypothetical protein n=1 Tax=Bradyrhizobium sp. Ghvi TaxID=1855319 RepID=UPI001177F171|nr:hypothetical protein [Bradyrhizobium sp. Ghvi]